MDLMGSRVIGMGLSPIWWSEIQRYCEVKGLDDFQTEAMHHHIRAMDKFYLEFSMKKSK